MVPLARSTFWSAAIVQRQRDKGSPASSNRWEWTCARTRHGCGLSSVVWRTHGSVWRNRTYEDLARRVGTVYHCAAAVNWALGYRRLRASNVVGTLEIIRFACVHAPKQVFFCSTIAVCFASPGPENVDESTDMLPYIEGMPLGYAQSKCVAESLLREAARRGVPVSIVQTGADLRRHPDW